VELLRTVSLAKIPGRCLLIPRLGELVSILPLITKLVILLPLLLVRQNLISLIYLFKLRLCRLIARVNIRMMLASQLAVSLLYLPSTSIPINP
jgi:hypothetical protein